MPEYWSIDKKFGLQLDDVHLQKISSLCRNAQRKETGGILLGKYDDLHYCAVVAEVSGPSQDSLSGGTWFIRGTRGLQKLIKVHWETSGSYYLGEWHFHPFASPTPSNQDIAQMEKIAKSAAYRCPEPVLVIAGGDPMKQLHFRAFVFPNGKMIEMLLTPK